MINSFYANFASLLKEKRIAKKMSQESLAEKVQTVRGTISRVESGKFKFTFELGIKLAKEVGINPDELWRIR